jgi:hypothetical protein
MCAIFKTSMKSSILLLAVLSSSVWAADDEEVIPVARGKERYEAMVAKSPFVLATPPEAPKVEAKSIFDNMVLKGVGTDYVIVQRVGDDHTMRFWGNEPNEEQMMVKEVRWSDQLGGTTVVLKKGAEEKEIEFNKNELRNPTPPPTPAGRPPGAPPIPGQRQPGMNPSPNFPKPPNLTNSTVPRPTVQPSMAVPRPSGAAIQAPPAPQPANNPSPNDATGNRRRIRVIGN